MSMSELTYEKYLQEFGVQSIRTGLGEPEILRFARSWTQPVNTVNPSDGTPSSAWVWSDQIALDKAKRFDEPGFIVQLGAIRPKMFYGNVETSIVGNLWGFKDWFPIYNSEDPNLQVRVINTDDPVFNDAANGAEASDEMWYDHSDILNHGEQFVNTSTHPFALPTASAPSLLAADDPEDLRGEYCTSSDVDGLFVSSTGTDAFCYYEGITSLVISGHSKDLIK